MHNRLKINMIWVLLLSCFGLVNAHSSEPESGVDIRVLIDVSGSMKQNDPANLRVPALKLLINLLPENSRSGVWLFAEKTQELISFSPVNQQWRNAARKVIDKVHSRGLLTDIEDALLVATKDWLLQSGNDGRNLILLTDGVVDVGKDFMENSDSRERIISSLLPNLKQSSVKIHTIALSENTDLELLRKLSFDSDGWSELVHESGQLQRVFLKMFKKAVPQDNVPIKDNKFRIDSKINEFSVLLFKQLGAPASKLISPEGQELSQEKISENVQWLNEQNYDLVTVKQPKAGEWKIVAKVDPDNQVMVVTDLKLKFEEIPNHIGDDEPLNLLAHFTDQNKIITRNDFIDLISLTVELTDSLGKKLHWVMQQMGDSAGYFKQQIDEKLVPGKYSIRLLADGKTFTREINETIEVVKMPVKLTTRVDQVKRIVHVQIIPDERIIDTSFMNIQALIKHSNKDQQEKNIELKNGIGSIAINAAPEGQHVIVNFSMMAKSVQGNPITPHIRPLVIDDKLFAKSKQFPVMEKKPKESEQEEKTLSKKEADIVIEQKETATLQDEPAQVWKTAGIVIGINVLILISGFFIYRMQKKRAIEKQTKLMERLS